MVKSASNKSHLDEEYEAYDYNSSFYRYSLPTFICIYMFVFMVMMVMVLLLFNLIKSRFLGLIYKQNR